MRWSDRLHRRMTMVEGVVWTGALLVVSSACAAAAILAPALEERAGETAPQAAIMIELAPEPEAVRRAAAAVREDRQDAAERPEPAADDAGAPAGATSATAPAEVARPQPVPVTAPVPPEPEVKTATVPLEPRDPLEERMLAELENVAIPLPAQRPMPEMRPVVRTKAEKKPGAKKGEGQAARREAASAAAERPAALARASNRDAAQKTVASSSAGKGDATRWKSRVVAHLERRKRYPSAARARGEEGTVLVAFRIDGGGRVLSATLARSSGHRALDEAALSMVERASPVPAPPAGVGTSLTAPVRFVRR